MTHPDFPAGLSAISDNYDAILCDVWGVIHNGRTAFDEACDALVRYRQQGGRVCLITNAPVPKAQVIRYFEPLGVPAQAYDDCVSSGDATRAELEREAEKKIWLMGADESFDRDRLLWAGLDLDFAAPEEAELLLCMGLDDNANDEPEEYRDRLRVGVDRGLRMICANPDVKVRIGDRLIWCAGALAQIYEEMGGAVTYPGKPHPAIYQLCQERLAELGAGTGRILCIGDSPATDIKGASGMGFDSLYVGTGLAQHSDDFRTEVTDLLSDYGVVATYAMTGLRW